MDWTGGPARGSGASLKPAPEVPLLETTPSPGFRSRRARVPCQQPFRPDRRHRRRGRALRRGERHRRLGRVARSEPTGQASAGIGGLLRLRRPAPGPRRAVRRPGRDADDALVCCATASRRRQRPADPGAAQHRRRLVHPGDRRLARRARLHQQHVPHQRRAVHQPDRRLRPRRAAGRDDRPGRRARRQEGRPDRVGRRAQRRDQRPDRRLPHLPLRPRRGHQLHRLADRLRRRDVHRLLRPAVRPPGRLRRPGAVPRRRAQRPPPAGRTCPPRYSPAQEMRLRVLDFGIDKYGLNAYIYDTTNDGTTNYDRVLFSPHQGRRRRGRRPRARASGPTSR